MDAMMTATLDVNEIASTLSTWDARQVERFAENLPFLGQGCRSTFALNDDYVLKIAPEGRMSGSYGCQCFDDVYLCEDCETSEQRMYCYDPHNMDEIECNCERQESDYWYGQNVAEAAMWQELKDDEHARKFFVPVIASDPNGKWLIAERVTGVSWTEYRDRPDEFVDAVYSLGICDLKADNVGKRADGSWVVLDYGINRIWEEENGSY